MSRFLGWLLIGVVGFVLVSSRALYAIDANPNPYQVEQPDGKKVTLRLRGDEWFSVQEDLDGYTVIRNRGWFVYGRRDLNSGRLVSSGLRVGEGDPALHGLKPGIRPSATARAETAGLFGIPVENPHTIEEGGESSPPSASSHASGTLRNLVVLIQWSDQTGRTVPSVADIDILMNHAGPHALAPTGSVRDVYLESSYGALTLESTVADWVVSDNTEAYYANGNRGLTTLTHDAIRDALQKVDQTVNFLDFDQDGDGYIDSITFLHSGYGAEWGGTDAYGGYYLDRIWSHKWSLYTGNFISEEGVRVNNYHISPAVWGTSGSAIGRIGVIAHETGHFLGLPDLYDTDGGGDGIGSFGLMANSWGFDGSQRYPPHMCPWSKIQLGWLSPTVITSAGSYSINQVETSAEVYRIDLGYPSGEYLLIENRQPVGFDGSPSFSQGGGLAIYHIDELAGYNSEGYPTAEGWSGTHYKIALLQSDGWYDLEHGWNRGDEYDTWNGNGNGDEITVSVDPNTGPFPNTDSYQNMVFQQTNNRIYNISASGATMTFSFEVIAAPSDPPAAPTGLAAATASHDQIDLNWTDNATDEDVYKVERSVGDESNYAEIASLAVNATSYSDTGLSPNTTYFYRVRAGNVAGDSTYSNSASATTDPPPPPPIAPTGLVATAVSDVAIDLGWLDASSDEDDFVVRRSPDGVSSWADIAVVPANSTTYQDTGLNGNTTYYYQVLARNAWGTNGSNVASATTDPPPAFVDTFADLDIAVAGDVQNTYLATLDADQEEQIITERESGGRPSRRHSSLEHQWRFSDVRGGLAVTLFASAWAPANGENDDFDVQVSTNGGSSWSTLFTIQQGSAPGTLFSESLPTGDPGTFYVRVVDTDQTEGSRGLDSVHIDQLYFRTDLDPTDTEPNPPTNLVASASSSSEIGLSWIDNSDNERGFRILRSDDGVSFQEIATVPIDSQSFSDTTVTPNSTFYYKVRAYTLSFQADSNVASATTPDGIALNGTGSKKKGKAVGNLTWTGGSSLSRLDIWRSIDGGPWELVANVANSGGGSYTDETGVRASTLEYQVCSETSPPDRLSATVASNIVTIFF